MILLLLAITSYPVQPQRLLLVTGWFIFSLIAAATVAIFVLMERDAIMSRITKSTIGKVDWNWNFILRVTTYAVLPLLTIFSAQFPLVGRTLLPG